MRRASQTVILQNTLLALSNQSASFHSTTVVHQRRKQSKTPTTANPSSAAAARRPPSPTRTNPVPPPVSSLIDDSIADPSKPISVRSTMINIVMPTAVPTIVPPAPSPAVRSMRTLSDLLQRQKESSNEKERDLMSVLSEAQLTAETNSASTTTKLVYCPLNGKSLLENSAIVIMLKTLGFGVNEKRELVLQDEAILNRFATKLWEMRKAALLTPTTAPTTTSNTDSSSSMATTTSPSMRYSEVNAKIDVSIEEFSEGWPLWLKHALLPAVRHASKDGSSAATRVQRVIQHRESQARIRASAFDVGRSLPGAQEPNAQNETNNKNDMSSVDVALHGVELNEEQELMIQLVLQGYNTYIAGSAGTGKTVLVRGIQRRLQELGLRVAMTATTGIAGCHIGGTTFHHAMGANIHGEFLKPEEMLQHDVVIIDEVSMLGLKMFEDFDRILREQAGTPDVPFGGIQVILCGDFLQLSAVKEKCVIESDVFQRHFVKAKLTKQVRQAENPEFAAMLSQIRLGQVPSNLFDKIPQLPPTTLVDDAVNLLPTNKEVLRANARELERLPGTPLRFAPLALAPTVTHRSSPSILSRLVMPESKPDRAEVNKVVRKIVEDKIGPLPHGTHLTFYPVFGDGYCLRLVFNSAATEEFCEEASQQFLNVAAVLAEHFPQLKVTEIIPSSGTEGLCPEESEKTLAEYVEKHVVAQAQDCKIGARVMLRANLTQTLVNGSIGTVVAFAPCKVESLHESIRDETLERAVAQYATFCATECGMSEALLPVVRFANGDEIAIPPWQFEVGGGPNTHHFSTRVIALPLSLGYAFTVHKVQGLTLTGRVHLELSNMWACEHLLYVAMSRVKNPEQLSMSAFKEEFIVSNPECLNFDAGLPAAANALVLDTFQEANWRRVIRDARDGRVSPLHVPHTKQMMLQERQHKREMKAKINAAIPEGVLSDTNKALLQELTAKHEPQSADKKATTKNEKEVANTSSSSTTTILTKPIKVSAQEASRTRQAKRLAQLAERYLRKPTSTANKAGTKQQFNQSASRVVTSAAAAVQRRLHHQQQRDVMPPVASSSAPSSSVPFSTSPSSTKSF